MAECIPKLVDKGFQNWLKANLALNITKEGISGPVINEVNTFHRDALNDILTPDQILNNDFCTECTNENILPCPTRGICIVKAGSCSFHQQRKSFRPCPKYVCDRLRDKIRKYHKFNFPSWKNTNSERWCTNPWEMAKCYLPPDGYAAVNAMTETDLNGILSLLMNHSTFKNQVDEQSCEEARCVSRRVRHSPNLCVNDQELNRFLGVLVTFLTCSGLFQGDQKATESVQKINKLKTESLTITTRDVTGVLQDVIRENVRGSLEEINKTTAERAGELKADIDKLETVTSTSLNDILTAKVAAIADIEKKNMKIVADINDLKESAIKEMKKTFSEIKADTDAALKDIRSSAEETKLEMKQDVDKRKLEAVNDMEDLEQKSLKKLRQTASTINATRLTDADYQQLKNEFKEDMLAFNRDTHSTIPLAPLFEEHETDLLGFYVSPTMNSVEIKRTKIQGPGSEIRTPVTDLNDVFKKSSNRCKRIFFTSEAGQGKTAFCKHLVLAWCNAHDINSKEISYFKEADLDTMREFEFVFLVFLRDASATDCDVDDMVQNQIVQCLSRSSKYSLEVVQTILHREPNLVILDGLDEWTHPEQTLSSCRRNPEYLPHRKVREKCTLLTTTRSWKLSIANLRSSLIDNHIHIESLDHEASKRLIHNVVTKINRNYISNMEDIKRNIDKITTEIRSRAIQEFEINPLILTYLVCLWCDGKPLGQSKCEVYANVLELLVLRAIEKCPDIEVTCATLCSAVSTAMPACFEKRDDKMKACYSILIALGRLAFQALFSQDKEKTLVFDASFVEGILHKSICDFSLSTGLLVQNKVPGQLTSRATRMSFPHKTFQEFFAALYIQSQSDLTAVTEQVLERCSSVETILEMSNVFIFLSGLDPEKIGFLSKKLCDRVSEDDITTTYRREQLAYFRSKERLFKDLQNMYIACVKESTNNKNDSIDIKLEDFIIDKECDNVNYFRMLSSLILLNVKSIKSVALYNCVSEIGTKEIINRLRLEEIQTLERLCLRCPITNDNLERLLACSLGTMKQLTIHGLVWQNNRLYPVHNSLPGTSVNSVLDLTHLESLSLVNIELSHGHLEQLTHVLSQRTHMKQITLYDIKCTDHEQTCNGVKVDLLQHSQLKFAGFGKVPLSDVQIHISNLEECALGDLQNRNALSSYLSALRGACKLQRLSCSEVDKGLDIVLDTIPLLVHLQYIIMYGINMTNKGIRLSADMVDIEFIMIEDAKMTNTAFEQFVRDLEQLKQTVKVQLHDCIISPAAEYEKMKRYVRASSRFEVLDDGKVKTVLGEEYNGFVFETVCLKEPRSEQLYSE